MGLLDAKAVAADIGVHLDDKDVAYLEKLAKDYPGCSDWRMWMKNRLQNMGFLRAGCEGAAEVTLYTVLHVFNLYRADVLPSTGMYLFSPEVARSKVIRGVVVPTPIDRTAWKVAPDKERKALEKMRELFMLDE